MRIEEKIISTTKQPVTPSSWESFFAHFSSPPSDQEKEEMINHFVQHLSHLINEHMKRMINVYKHMKEQQ